MTVRKCIAQLILWLNSLRYFWWLSTCTMAARVPYRYNDIKYIPINILFSFQAKLDPYCSTCTFVDDNTSCRLKIISYLFVNRHFYGRCGLLENKSIFYWSSIFKTLMRGSRLARNKTRPPKAITITKYAIRKTYCYNKSPAYRLRRMT